MKDPGTGKILPTESDPRRTATAKGVWKIDFNPKRAPTWLIDFQKQLIRGKHIVLYGNIHDLFLYNDQFLSLTQLLDNFFLSSTYDIVGQYDMVDGFVFAQSGMHNEFQGIVNRAGQAPAPAPMTTNTTVMGQGGMLPSGATARPMATNTSVLGQAGSLPGSPAGTARRQSPAAAAEATAAPVRQTPGSGIEPPRPAAPPASNEAKLAPNQAVEAIRIVLGQTQRTVALRFMFADMLVAGTDHFNEQERKDLTRLMKSLQSAPFHVGGKLKGRRNALVLVVKNLGALPEWIHADNPLLELIKIDRPSTEERVNFFRHYRLRFHGGADIPEEKALDIASDFSQLTEGFSFWDLEAVRRTSIADEIPLCDVKRLIDFYKYGAKEDPWERVDEQRIQSSREKIQLRVLGQTNALDAVESMLINAKVGISLGGARAKGGKPKGVFFFVGPTGVGKTELAKALTELIFGDESAFARFDMSEYKEQHAAERLTGAPPGYVGYERGGLLTNRVRERPFSLLLFDEIEKAHGSVMDKFLQILDDGRLTDGKGQTAYFSQTAIIFTSNIGSDELLELFNDRVPSDVPYKEIKEHYERAVQDHFRLPPDRGGLGRPELLSRLGDNILVFDVLRPAFVAGICKKFLALLTASALEQHQLRIAFPDDSVIAMIQTLMTQRENFILGGRRIKKVLETVVETPLNRWAFFNRVEPGTPLALTATAGKDPELLINGHKVPKPGVP